jgi:diacylglycerol kinase (ATP)
MIKREILIVVNPAAGRSAYQKRLQYLQAKLADVNLEFSIFYTEKGDGGKLRNDIEKNKGINEIIVMGGDGTLNSVVNELYGTNLPISIISNGTGNDTVKSLHGEMRTEKQVETALHGTIRNFDLGLCNDRYFVNGFGIGFDGQVVKEMIDRGENKRSHLDYLFTVLRIIGSFSEQRLKFSVDGRPFDKRILLMTVTNGTTFGGGFKLNPFAKTNDGLLDVCILNEVRPLLRFWHLPKLKSGAHHYIKQSEFYKAKQVVIEANHELSAHIDGEYIGNPPFKISAVKDALRLKTPN